jgi:hypothetical protein
MATTTIKPKATPPKKDFEIKDETQIELLNKDFNPSLINEEERTRLINAYSSLAQKDFEQKDGESIKDVFARVAAKIGLTSQALYDYLRNK